MIAGSKTTGGGPHFVELQYVRLMRDQLPTPVWQRPAVIARALAVQLQAERAATPADVRVQHWTAAIVSSGDLAARQARDAFFAGDSQSLATADTLWTGAERRYGHAERLGKTLASALTQRDQAFAEIPYLAEWMARPLPAGLKSQTFDAEINDALLPLIHANNRLASELAQENPSVANAISDSPSFEQDVQQVHARLSHAESSFAEAVRAAQADKKKNAVAWRHLQALLATPLVAAGDRQELRKSLAQLSARLNSNTVAAAAEEKSGADAKKSKDGDDPKAPAIDDVSYLERSTTAWHDHPALAILAPEDSPAPQADAAASDEPSTARPASVPKKQTATGRSASSDLRSLSARQGERVRELLAALPGKLRRLHDIQAPPESTGPVSFDKPTALADADAAAQEADRLARAAAGLGLPALDFDPVRRLRQWDLQKLLLWNCGRALDDFWGSAAGQSDPLFSTVATDYLRAAQSLGELNSTLLVERNRLAKMLELRRGAARSAVHVAAADVLLPDEVDNITLKLGAELTAAAANHAGADASA